jgi:hypothetical protein
VEVRLIGGAVAEEGDRGPPLALAGERGARRRGDAAADDPEAADQASLEVDDVHRSGAPAANPGGAAEHLRGQRLRVGSLRQRVTVPSVRTADVVGGLERHADPDGDRLLTGRQVGGPVDLTLQE